MWRGAISFGMVAIPVRLYLATESKSVSFRLLCPSCHRPIKQKRWCPHEEKEISWSEALRGYEVAREEFVLLEDADLEGLPLASKQVVEILEFVDDSASTRASTSRARTTSSRRPWASSPTTC
jgi:DNA end-binding protein Ku